MSVQILSFSVYLFSMESAVRSTKHRGRSKKGNNASNSSISNSTSSSSSSSSVSNYNNADDGRALTDKSYNFSEVGEIHANVATKSMIAPMDTKEFSRDEIVSNLMIMGFPESGISLSFFLCMK